MLGIVHTVSVLGYVIFKKFTFLKFNEFLGKYLILQNLWTSSEEI
jgi:hypothetical protein